MIGELWSAPCTLDDRSYEPAVQRRDERLGAASHAVRDDLDLVLLHARIALGEKIENQARQRRV